MIIYYSGGDSRYGIEADAAVFRTSVMMTFAIVGKDLNQRTRFFELLEQRNEQPSGGKIDNLLLRNSRD
jgi:hypothetical protein